MAICRFGAFSLSVIASLACGLRPRPGPDSGPVVPPTVVEAPLSSHCDVLRGTLERNGMQCLEIPGMLALGVYGTRQYPNESTLDEGFGHQIPDGVIGTPRAGGTITKGYHQTRSINASAGLDLSMFVSWLPKAKLKAAKNDEVSVEITLGELTIIPVQNLPRKIASVVDSVSTDSRTVETRAMLTQMCKPDTVVSSLVLIAKPIIRISTKASSNLEVDVGWKNIVGFALDDSKSGGGSVTLVSDVPITFAAQLRDSRPWLQDLCDRPPCGTEGNTCCSGATCESGLACEMSKCIKVAPPPPDPRLTGAKVTWKTTGDDKDWDTQPVVDVYDNSGRHIAHIDCCSADRNSDKWSNGQSTTRDLEIKAPGTKLSEVSHGRFKAMRNPVGNDDWDYTATVELLFSDIVVRQSCGGRNSCEFSW